MSYAPLFDKHDITHIRGVDHPESIGIGPRGEAYTTGTGCQVYRLNLEDNLGEQFASTEARCLGTAVDADGNLYAAHTAGDEDGAVVVNRHATFQLPIHRCFPKLPMVEKQLQSPAGGGDAIDRLSLIHI